jgi:hypothetical protein
MTNEYIPPADTHYSHIHWKDELDMLGSIAPLEVYEAHLAKAPLPTHFDVGYLAGYIEGRRYFPDATWRRDILRIAGENL